MFRVARFATLSAFRRENAKPTARAGLFRRTESSGKFEQRFGKAHLVKMEACRFRNAFALMGDRLERPFSSGPTERLMRNLLASLKPALQTNLKNRDNRAKVMG